MKSKIVIWGHKDDQKYLLAMSLRALESKIDTYAFPESIVTEEFSSKLNQEWKNDVEIEFPEGYTHFETDLKSSGEILPAEFTVTDAETISRAQIEWQFFVLSAKLAASYNSELEIIKDKIAQAKEFSQPLWDELKLFWDKVQGQIREKNIIGNHITDLRKSTNEVFESLKEKRKELDRVFNETSSLAKSKFLSTIQGIEERIDKGMSLHPIFEELKSLQNDFRKAVMTASDKRNVWDKLDAAFKIVKEKRYGTKVGSSEQNSAKERLANRYNGLLAAISKMEQSIEFDKKDMDFQTKKMDGQVGQLELQIRQAKLKMIEDRIQSKQAKLNDMLSTKSELEQRMERIEKSEAANAKKEEAKKMVQDKIAADIKAASELRQESSEDLEKAAQKIAESKKARQSTKSNVIDSIETDLNETMEDVVDTVKAVGSVLGNKLGDLIDDLTDKAADMLEGVLGDEQTEEAKNNQPEEATPASPTTTDIAASSEEAADSTESDENKENEEPKP